MMGNLKEIDEEKEINTCAVCNVQASQTCSVCKLVAYCSKEHQKQHWNSHKLVCKPYEIKSNDKLGRYLIASKNILHDEKILEEPPLIIGPRLLEATPICLGCYRSPTPGMRCPKCNWPVCQSQCPGLTDPHHHSIECFILSLGKPKLGILRYEIITPLRGLLLQKRNPKKWQKLINMESHLSDRGPTTDIYKEVDETIVNCLIEDYLSKLNDSLNYSREIIHQICGVLDINAVEIRGTEDISLLSLYPTFAIMEHTCLPNTNYFFSSDYKVVLLSNCNIKKGQHISTSYTHVLWGTVDRRDHLKQNKCFACQCERCSDPTEFGTYFSALRCLAKNQTNVCGGWQLPLSPLDEESDWICNKCQILLKFDEMKELTIMLSDETEKIIKQGKPSVADVSELIKKLEFFLHPHHYLCYESKHLLIQLYGNQSGYLHSELTVEQLKYKQEICEDLLMVNNILDPGYSRLSLYSAVLMYELHAVTVQLILRKELPMSSKEEVKQLLTNAANTLEHEPLNSPGSKMKLVAIKSLNELNNKLNNEIVEKS